MNAISPQRKEELLEKLRIIENALSPENLCMDGEASPSYIRNTSIKLHTQRDEVIGELGYEPNFNELYPN